MTELRAVRAVEDVLAVDEHAPGMVRVTTWGDSYIIDARGEGCNCPDKKFNHAPRCKHETAAILADYDHLPTPYVTEVDEREACEACEALPDGWQCWPCTAPNEIGLEQ